MHVTRGLVRGGGSSVFVVAPAFLGVLEAREAVAGGVASIQTAFDGHVAGPSWDTG